jgi:NAD(P)-dependent dehydrogenase (short-subunit alcohol dehydrogenase family)
VFSWFQGVSLKQGPWVFWELAVWKLGVWKLGVDKEDPLRLEGKVALVTGAARGIGRGIAEIFAEEGADVAINDIDSGDSAQAVAHWVRAKGRRAVVVHGDVGRRDEVEPMIDRVWSELGAIDILVNNAGIETIVPFLELTDEQWTRLVDTNLRGAWLCSQVYCRRAIAERRAGNIVNIGSIQAAKVLPGRTHYAPTKLGLEALTRNMSAEMTPHGIRVNCIHPGLIATDMTAWVMNDPALLPGVLAQISLGRAGQPREIGTVAAFFASDDASYLTGQSIFVDGGWQGK